MSEPTLEGIEDYNNLRGEKRKIVYSVVIVGILLFIAYSIAYSVFDNADENIKVEKSINKIPMK